MGTVIVLFSLAIVAFAADFVMSTIAKSKKRH